MKLESLSDMPVGESITLLAYGASGKGKTFFCGTAGPRTAIINIGAGLATLQSPAFKKKYPSYDPLIVTINEEIGPQGFVENATLFDQTADAVDELVEKHRDRFDTLCIDDATALGSAAMNKAIEVNTALGILKVGGLMKKYQTNIPGIAEFGREMNMIEKFLAAITDIAKRENFNFILTAHERCTYRKPEQVGGLPVLQSIRPGFTGQTFPDKVPAYFDEVWNFSSKGEGDKWRITARTRGNSIITAKSRNGGIFNEIEENPDFSELLTRIQKANAVLTK
jgi:hypothetical protein